MELSLIVFRNSPQAKVKTTITKLAAVNSPFFKIPPSHGSNRLTSTKVSDVRMVPRFPYPPLLPSPILCTLITAKLLSARAYVVRTCKTAFHQVFLKCEPACKNPFGSHRYQIESELLLLRFLGRVATCLTPGPFCSQPCKDYRIACLVSRPIMY